MELRYIPLIWKRNSQMSLCCFQECLLTINCCWNDYGTDRKQAGRKFSKCEYCFSNLSFHCWKKFWRWTLFFRKWSYSKLRFTAINYEITELSSSAFRRQPKFSPITACMRDVLHWLPISLRIQYRIRPTAMVSRCVLRCAPYFLHYLCCPARRVLHSAASFWVSRARLAIMQLRAFSVVGLWAHRHGIISLLSCVPCWWPDLPNFTSLSSPSSLAVTGLRAPLSSNVLKRRYTSRMNEWMNETKTTIFPCTTFNRKRLNAG